VLLVLLCLVLPFVAVLIRDGPCLKVLWAFLLQLCVTSLALFTASIKSLKIDDSGADHGHPLVPRRDMMVASPKLEFLVTRINGMAVSPR
jgi:uncharacterized membrane protein YqaE (UPF0057 family)